MPDHTMTDPVTETVEMLYRLLLGRPADQGGLQHYVAMLHGGASLADVARLFVGSEEFALSGGAGGLAVRLGAAPPGAAASADTELGVHPLAPWPFLYTPENAPFFSHRGLFRPAMLMVETVNICNHDCVICPYSAQTRPRRAMPQPLFEKLIADYAAIGGGPVSLTPLVGEVFLDKLLPERLATLRGTAAVTKLSATTNATMARRYKDERLTEILSAFERVKVSVYGLDAEEFRLMTRRDEYAHMVEQLVRMLALARPGTVVVGLRHLRNRPPEEVQIWLDGIAKRAGVDEVEVASKATEYANWSHFDTSKPLPLDATWRPTRENQGQCLIPLVAMQAMSDGTISFCACANFDGNDDLTLGHVGERTLAELFDSEKARRLWRWERCGVPDFCRTCSFHMPMDAAKGLPWLMKDPTRFVGG
jgi:Domain of unknown function (DUF4214)/Radical SAM superfamily/Iron-sulfur cluster-binding domain